jgi:tetratricopeptide (TPR) repeat protein
MKFIIPRRCHMLNPDINERIRELEEKTEESTVNPDEISELLNDCMAEYQHFISSRQHDEAINLMERLRSLVPDEPRLDRLAALAYGGKGELILEWADRLRLKPGKDLLEQMESVFRRAIEVDPTLADPYWDIAVLRARFAEDFDEAQRCYTKARSMGYQHPMMPALEQMLHARQAPAGPVHESEDETSLRELLLKLAIHPDIPFENIFDPRQHRGLESLGDDPVFDTYYRAGIRIVKGGKLSSEAYESVLHDALLIGGDAGEYLLDVLRRISFEYSDNVDLQKLATEEHLKILARASFNLRGQSQSNDDTAMRRARRTARRGLDIIESNTQFSVDPDIHADMLLAMGQIYSRVESPTEIRLAETLTYYLPALDLKEKADNRNDVQSLKDLLGQIIEFLIPMAHLSGAVGLGTTLRGLELAYEAAQRLDDPALTCGMAVTLSNIYSSVRQPQLAEELLRDLLSDDNLTAQERDKARLALASALSEQHRGREAAEIQEALIAENSFLLGTPEDKALVYRNYANSLRVEDDLDGALNAFETAMASASQVKESATRQEMQSQLHALMGEVEFLKGNLTRGDAAIKQAESMLTVDLAGTGRIFFHSAAGRSYFKAKMYDDARRHLNAARQALLSQLERGAWPSVWESMLNSWSDLDVMLIQIQLADGTEEETRSALAVAEAAKGRLLTWLSLGYMEEAPKIALSPTRHKSAVEKIREWTVQKPGRYVVSLFANKAGLGIFVLGEGDCISGTWLEEVEYDAFMKDFYEPWECLIDTAVSSDSYLRDASGAFTELILDRIGEWLWRACPQLAKGGNKLVLIPHRLFRSLPLSHCRLPGGKRLSESFKQVIISPSLYDLSEALYSARRTSDEDSGWMALVDPDGSLPFARFEGVINAGQNATKTGNETTVDAIHQALSASEVVLISCHGDFEESNPWQSSIQLADRALEVHELLNPSYRIVTDLVVLGACETARTRRSVSDEPLGFPGMMIQAGVRAVLAPLWKADDFSSLIFLTHFFEAIKAGANPVSAAKETAHWLRELQAREAVKLADEMLTHAENLVHSHNSGEALVHIPEHLTQIRDWLQTLGRDERPFRSPLDWAAFQLVGLPSINPQINNSTQ